MSRRYIYSSPDERINEVYEMSYFDYFIGSDSNINSSLIIASEVEKTIFNDLGEVETKLFQLKEPKYVGDELTLLDSYDEQGVISKTCFLVPNDCIDFFEFEDVGNEPKLLDFFSEQEILYFSSLPTFNEENGNVVS